MSNVIVHASWLPNGYSKMGEIDHELEVHVYVGEMPTTPVPRGVFRIIAILEPFRQHKLDMIKYFVNHKKCYNHIFTYYEDILSSFKNSTLSVSPTTWVRDVNPTIKEFNVSTIIGGKHQANENNLEGYGVRWDLFTKMDRIKLSKKFYLSSHFPIKGVDYKNHLILGDSKAPLFDSQFHIAIENTNSIRNAFSEKLIDCFQTRTIPIYYGPENIGDFFNINGIFLVNNVSEIIDVCNSLNENTYNSLIDAVEENYNLSMNYRNMDETMLSSIKKLLLNK